VADKPRDRFAIAVRQVELTQALAALTDVTRYNSVRVFITWHDVPLGTVDIANFGGPISASRLRDALVDKLAPALLKPLLAQQYSTGVEAEARLTLPPLTPKVSVSVVIATFDRPNDLRQCLCSLQHQDTSRRVEVVVVDNHPASGVTSPVLAEFPDVVLVREPRQGLAYARNAGFVASTGDIVLATDDDVVLPASWLERLVAPFADDSVMATTGNVLPYELETMPQQLFEVYGGLGRGFKGKVAGLEWLAQFAIAPPTWELGATANAAFRAAIFTHRQIGLMCEALGPGMPSGVGEDVYLFYKILKAGYKIVYEPAAYVWHKHRRTMAELRRQLYGYSRGHVGYLLTTLFCDHDLRALVRLGYELPHGYAWYVKERLLRRRSYPLSLVALEIIGHALGPWALWQSVRRVKREGRSQPYVPPAQRPPRVSPGNSITPVAIAPSQQIAAGWLR
jgi:GT2 family glycosyltransferase